MSDATHEATETQYTHAALDRYHRRICRAEADLPRRQPWRAQEREEIRRTALDCLNVDLAWKPRIAVQQKKTLQADGLRVDLLCAQSWPGVVATAHFYRAGADIDQPRPTVLLFCGHGKCGKLSPGYQRMARHLVRQGANVLVPDNIGQGEREPMGHRDVLGPFACGTTLLGLILLESLAWIDWARAQPAVDPAQVAAIGNSGGGTICTFLAALAPELAAVSASGYPSRFDLIARKEKKHCHCNLIRGIVGRLEMSDLLACAAPRPLLIFQGENDQLVPYDAFHQTAREIGAAYACLGAPEAFRHTTFAGCFHPWGEHSFLLVADFLRVALPLSLNVPLASNEALLEDNGRCLDAWPADALHADALAQQVTGRSALPAAGLWEVFRPEADLERLVPVTPRGDTRQILAQMECFCNG